MIWIVHWYLSFYLTSHPRKEGWKTGNNRYFQCSSTTDYLEFNGDIPSWCLNRASTIYSLYICYVLIVSLKEKEVFLKIVFWIVVKSKVILPFWNSFFKYWHSNWHISGCFWDTWSCGSRLGCTVFWSCFTADQRKDGSHWSGRWDNWCWSSRLSCSDHGKLQSKSLWNLKCIFFFFIVHYLWLLMLISSWMFLKR